jgi:hypothetical protein
LDTRQCVEKEDLVKLLRLSCPVVDDSADAPNAEGSFAEDAAPCVVYLHGNCGCRLDSIDILDLCLLYGFSVFCVDLSGSGLSEGEVISLGYFEQEDVKTISDYLKTVPFVSTICMCALVL